MMSKTSQMINFRLSLEATAELDEFARANNMTRSDVVRAGVRLVLQRARNTPSEVGVPQ